MFFWILTGYWLLPEGNNHIPASSFAVHLTHLLVQPWVFAPVDFTTSCVIYFRNNDKSHFFYLNFLPWKKGGGGSVFTGVGLAWGTFAPRGGGLGQVGQPHPAPREAPAKSLACGLEFWSTAGLSWGHGPHLVYTRSFLPPGLALAVPTAWQNFLVIQIFITWCRHDFKNRTKAPTVKSVSFLPAYFSLLTWGHFYQFLYTTAMTAQSVLGTWWHYMLAFILLLF